MKLKLSIMAMTLLFAFSSSAQDVDEIISNYFENTGGYDNWKNLKGIKMMAKVNQQGLEIPLEIVALSDGRQYTKINFQGNTIYQGVFDGETLWNTNFASMQAEKADAEATERQKLDANDFPDGLLDYKSKGYAAEFLGMETVEGAEVFKVKLTKEPITVDGQQVDDVNYYYFDTEYFLPIVQESEIRQGPQKGAMGQSKLSDYEEVEGLYFPFALTQGVKDGPSQPITIESIEVNPEVDETLFDFPGN